jgi:hypothetical protein
MPRRARTGVLPKKKRLHHITKRRLYLLVTNILIPQLNLVDWTIKVKFTKKMKNLADCEASPEYKSAKIRVNLESIKSLSYHEVVGTALHELLHCISWDIMSWAEQLSRGNEDKLEICRRMGEALTTDMEQILFPLVSPIVHNELRELGYVNLDVAPQLEID